MSLENSPRVEEFIEGIPEKKEKKPKRKINFWIVISVLFISSVIMQILHIYSSQRLSSHSATGTISGTIIDKEGKPVIAEVFVEGTDLRTATMTDGTFNITGVPVGNQVVGIGYEGTAIEIPVVIIANTRTDIGVAKVISTAMP